MQRHVVEMVQVPEEPKDELYMFLVDHREWICSLIQADRPDWDDRLFSALRRVLGRQLEQVPDEELKDELYAFLMERREWICSLIQADRLGWDDRLFSAPRHVSEHSRLGQDDRGVPNSVPQDPPDDDNIKDNKAKH